MTESQRCGCEGEENRVRQSEADGLDLPGPRTDEVYQTANIPNRFMYPKLMRGYRETESSSPHPCYRSTAMDYGWFTPTIHTVPTAYYPRNYAFSGELARGGMYRNCSLNTELDK